MIKLKEIIAPSNINLKMSIEEAHSHIDRIVRTNPKERRIPVKFEWMWAEYGKWDHLSGHGTLNAYTDMLTELRGYANEKRKWHYRHGELQFGLYRIDEWLAFLEDIAKNGIQNPITINIEPDGEPLVFEGNHRIQAAKQLKIKIVPIELRIRGRGEDNLTDSKWMVVVGALQKKFNWVRYKG